MYVSEVGPTAPDSGVEGAPPVLAHDMLERLKTDKNFFSNIFNWWWNTGVRLWPQTKLSSSQRKISSQPPKNARQVRNKTKMMFITFSGQEGNVRNK